MCFSDTVRNDAAKSGFYRSVKIPVCKEKNRFFSFDNGKMLY